MSLLKNPKHEMFAGLVAKGETAGKAYRGAGYSEGGADQGACRLAKLPKIQARIVELKEFAVKVSSERTGISKAWVLEQLRENAQKAMQAEPVLDRDGAPTGEYRYEGSVVNRALELIGKELGMFVDRRQEVPNIEDVPDDVLREWAQAATKPC